MPEANALQHRQLVAARLARLPPWHSPVRFIGYAALSSEARSRAASAKTAACASIRPFASPLPHAPLSRPLRDFPPDVVGDRHRARVVPPRFERAASLIRPLRRSSSVAAVVPFGANRRNARRGASPQVVRINLLDSMPLVFYLALGNMRTGDFGRVQGFLPFEAARRAEGHEGHRVVVAAETRSEDLHAGTSRHSCFGALDSGVHPRSARPRRARIGNAHVPTTRCGPAWGGAGGAICEKRILQFCVGLGAKFVTGSRGGIGSGPVTPFMLARCHGALISAASLSGRS